LIAAFGGNQCLQRKTISRAPSELEVRKNLVHYARRPVCKAAMPPLKFSNSTSSKPAARIMPTRVSWFGNFPIDLASIHKRFANR
jgi:hypothetical protein